MLNIFKKKEEVTLQEKVRDEVVKVLTADIFYEKQNELKQREEQIEERLKKIDATEDILKRQLELGVRSKKEIIESKKEIEQEYHQNLRMANNIKTTDFYKNAMQAEGKLNYIKWLLNEQQ